MYILFVESDTKFHMPFETMIKQLTMTVPNQFYLYIDPQLQVETIKVKQQVFNSHKFSTLLKYSES